MLSTDLSTGILLVILAVAVVSFIAAYGSFHFCMKVWRNERDYRRLLLWMQELEDNHAALSDSHKRLRSRIGMQELRDRKKSATNGSQEPDDDDALAWKREMRIKLARGELKPR